jgi:hypothetical protein
MTSLVLDDQLQLPRPTDFEARRFPRTRSFHGSDAFVREVKSRPPGAGARFAGGIAAVYGADRELLGLHPTRENVDALVRKALLLVAPADHCSVEVVFVIDLGTKAAALQRYARELPRELIIEAHNYRKKAPRRIEITLVGNCRDAPDCARAALPLDFVKLEPRILLVDIGYLRTKFAVLSQAGCDHQEQLESLGVSDVVYRILRDGQEQGLVEDEFAVIRALEACSAERFDIGGRAFDVRKAFVDASTALESELVRVARRIIIQDCESSGTLCTGIAIIGGGAAIVGKNVAERLRRELGLHQIWIGEAGRDWLLEGAARSLRQR